MIFKHEPKLLILASRSHKSIEQTIAAIRKQNSAAVVKGVEVDVSDLDSVRKAAAEILELTPVVDVLINNAGIMSKDPYIAAELSADHHGSDPGLQDHQARGRDAVRH